MDTHMPDHVWRGQKTTLGSQLSPPTFTWAPRIKVQSAGEQPYPLHDPAGPTGMHTQKERDNK